VAAGVACCRLKGVEHGDLELDLQWFKVLDIQPRG
jgi:hypothetical protein